MNPHQNPQLAQLERELQSLLPLPPDPALNLRIQRSLSQPVLKSTNPKNVIPLKPWLAVAACAVASVGAVTWHQARMAKSNTIVATPSNDQPSGFVQKSSQTHFNSIQHTPIIVDPQHGPMRKVSVQFNNLEQFENPNGSRIEIQYPSWKEIWVPEPVQ